jgi:cytidine deaminase
MKLNSSDLNLIENAKQLLQDNIDLYKDKNKIVASVVQAKSGKIYKGINLLTSHSVCAEQVAIGQAFACGERDLDTIVAVKLNSAGETKVTSPCGLCRYIMNKLELENMNVILEDVSKGTVIKVTASNLLPYPYVRDNEEN